MAQTVGGMKAFLSAKAGYGLQTEAVFTATQAFPYCETCAPHSIKAYFKDISKHRSVLPTISLGWNNGVGIISPKCQP